MFPYFIGHILELPLTTTQDYALFHLLRNTSLELWEEQIRLIREKHGLIHILVHPDYILEEREQGVYLALLSYLDRLRRTEHVWITTPTQLNKWWRERNKLTLIHDVTQWRIAGDGCDRACLAYARLEGDTVRYEIPSVEAQKTTALAGTETTQLAASQEE